MKGRLSLLYFLQFGVWGCYLTSFGQFLGSGGIGGKIAWFYAAIGLVSIITPSLLGRSPTERDVLRDSLEYVISWLRLSCSPCGDTE